MAEALFFFGAGQRAPRPVEIEIVERERLVLGVAVDVREHGGNQRRVPVRALAPDGADGVEDAPGHELLRRHRRHQGLHGQPEVTGEAEGEAPLRAPPEDFPSSAISSALTMLTFTAASASRSSAVALVWKSASSSFGGNTRSPASGQLLA